MAKNTNLNLGTQSQRTQHAPPRHEDDRYVFRVSWLLVPLSILGMWYLLGHLQTVLKWDAVMDLLNVHNRERYSMLALLCLTLTFIVAAVRILGRKK